MENTKLKNKIVPWQEHGRWCKIVLHCEVLTGSTYVIVIDEYDDIFSTSNTNGKIYITISSSSLSMRNNTGVPHSIIDVKRVITGTDPSATQSVISTGATAAFLPDSTSSVSLATGFAAAAGSINKKFTLWFFID